MRYIVQNGSQLQVWNCEGFIPEAFICEAPEDESLYTSLNAHGIPSLDQGKLQSIIEKASNGV